MTKDGSRTSVVRVLSKRNSFIYGWNHELISTYLHISLRAKLAVNPAAHDARGPWPFTEKAVQPLRDGQDYIYKCVSA